MLPSRLTLILAGLLALTIVAAAVVVHWMHGRLDSVKAELAVEQANSATLERALADQNSAVEVLRADSAARVERAAQAVAAAQRPRARVIDALAAPAAGDTAAARVDDIDRRFMESLR